MSRPCAFKMFLYLICLFFLVIQKNRDHIYVSNTLYLLLFSFFFLGFQSHIAHALLLWGWGRPDLRFRSVGPSVLVVDFGEIDLHFAVADTADKKLHIGRVIVVRCHDGFRTFSVFRSTHYKENCRVATSEKGPEGGGLFNAKSVRVRLSQCGRKVV